MIVSHKGKFVIAVPNGLGAGPWLMRIAAEGPRGYLEIEGHPNSVCVPDGLETYARYFVDSPVHRLPQLWMGRKGTPWEGPKDVQAKLDDWLVWYVFKMRKKYLEEGVLSSPNGWGMRATHGEWAYFEHTKTLLRAFHGIGNSPKGEDAPWGVLEPKLLKIEELSKGWREVVRRLAPRGINKSKKEAERDHDLEDAVDLIKWHVPVMQQFYEMDKDLVNTYFTEGAWEYQRQNGIAAVILNPS